MFDEQALLKYDIIRHHPRSDTRDLDTIEKLPRRPESRETDAEKAVNVFLETVTETLKSGDKVAFTGFGSFEVIERAAREGRNPQTDETMQFKASKVPRFKAGKVLKDAVA